MRGAGIGHEHAIAHPETIDSAAGPISEGAVNVASGFRVISQSWRPWVKEDDGLPRGHRDDAGIDGHPIEEVLLRADDPPRDPRRRPRTTACVEVLPCM